MIISLLAGAAFPPHLESPAGWRHGVGEGLWPMGWIRPGLVGTGRSCQALPAAGSAQRSPPSLPGAGGLEEPPRHHEALAQPQSAFTLPFNLSTPDAARELTGSSMCSAGIGREHPWGTGGSPILPPHCGQRGSTRRAARAVRREKSQSKKVLYLLPQQRLCLWQGWSQDGLQLPRESI